MLVIVRSSPLEGVNSVGGRRCGILGLMIVDRSRRSWIEGASTMIRHVSQIRFAVDWTVCTWPFEKTARTL